ncbi:glycosyltransferase [Candidatus Allofournierella excrementigallinarum]|uniref:glycosyltransferase n=1 Tax=Candidatus Allofournierella excrementigallinarum TaxID=2838592 RepID=UPI00374EAF0A
MSEEKRPAISVIVPVYKVEDCLPACAESLLGQTFTDFELIFVDDGSPDGCGALCDGYAAKDGRVKVIHQQNGGLSAARNAGLDIAKGEAIAFVDSDDVVAADYLEKLHAALEEAGADMALCAVEDVDEGLAPLGERALTLPAAAGVFGGKDLLAEFFGPASTYYTVAWNKLYRRRLWQDLRYPAGRIHEDDAVAHLLFWQAKKVVCLADVLYFYRLRQGSICRTGLRPSAFDGVDAAAARCRFFTAHSRPDLAALALPGAWRRYLALCAQCGENALTWPLAARWQEAQAQMATLLPLLKNCPGLSAREKLSCRRWAKRALPLPPKTDKMRVALLLPPGLPVPAVKGGAVETLAEHLARQNARFKEMELAVLCQWDEEAAGESARFADTLFYYQMPPAQDLGHRLAVRLSALVGKPIHWNRWYAKPLPFLKRLDADWYLAEGGDLTGWRQASRALGRGRFVAHLHGETPGSAALDEICPRALCISQFVRRAWLAGSGEGPESAALVPNCADLDLFCPKAKAGEATALREKLGFGKGDFVVLFCGRTSPEKGVHQLLAAMANIPDEQVKLLVVGSPFFGAKARSGYADGLQSRAEALGGRVKFAGFVPNPELPAYYRMASAACFPALWQEPAGITAIEAMACGCPVIATASGGLPEYLEGSGAVILPQSEVWEDGQLRGVAGVPPLENTIAEAILALKADPARAAAMAKAGRKAAGRYAPETYYRTLLAALQSWGRRE